MREGEREESSVYENTDWDGEGEKYRLWRYIPDSLFLGLIFLRNGVTKCIGSIQVLFHNMDNFVVA